MKDGIAIGGNGVSYILALVQTNETMQIISFILSIITSIIIIAFKIWSWWRVAHSDGKITKEEVDDLIDDIKDDVEELQDKTKGGKK